MAIPKYLTAVAVLLLSISGAIACDDYPEEMALAAAQRDAKPAQSTTAHQERSAQAGATVSGQSGATGAAAVEPMPAQPQATANLAGALRQ